MSTASLHSLYRRLRRCGEEQAVIRRAVSLNGIEKSAKMGVNLLALHGQIMDVSVRRSTLRIYQIPSRIRLSLRSYSLWYKLLYARLKLRSFSAMTDLAITVLCLSATILVFQVYRIFRQGLIRAEDKFNMLAIPVLQTIQALDDMQELKRQRRKEMEDDIIKTRAN